MDKTVNKIIICFVFLVLFDTTSFTIRKEKYGMFSAVTNTIHQVYSFIKVVRN